MFLKWMLDRPLMIFEALLTVSVGLGWTKAPRSCGQIWSDVIFQIFHIVSPGWKHLKRRSDVLPCLANLWPHGLEDIFSDVRISGRHIWSSSKVWSATGTDYQCQGKICQSLLVTPACKTCLLQYVPFHFRFLWMSSWANYCLDDSQLYSSHPPKVLCNSDLIHQHGIAWFQERQSTLRVAFKVLFHQNTGKGDIRHRLGQIGTFRSTSSTLGAFEDGAHRAK